MGQVRHLNWALGLRSAPCTLRWGVPSRVPARMGWLNQTVARFASTLLLLLAMMGAADRALALDPGKNIDQYGHDVWSAQNGLPGEAVYQILQTREGYLWLRTSAGLVRFDGNRFELVEPVVDGHALREPVKAICRGADGDLLVRTTSRTLRYRNGFLEDYRKPGALPDGDIREVFESRSHDVLVSSDDFIYGITNSGVVLLREGTSWVFGPKEDDAGRVRIPSLSGVYE